MPNAFSDGWLKRAEPRAPERGVYRFTIQSVKPAVPRRDLSRPRSLNFPAEIRNGFLQAFVQRHCRLPAQMFFRLGDVGLALLGIILRQGFENDLAART